MREDEVKDDEDDAEKSGGGEFRRRERITFFLSDFLSASFVCLTRGQMGRNEMKGVPLLSLSLFP